MFCELLAFNAVLQTWKQNPQTWRRDYSFMCGWDHGPGADEPLPLKEVAWRKELLRIHAPSSFRTLFPEERTVVFPRSQRKEVIYELLNKRPFRPFFVLTSDCRAVEIDKRVVLEFDCLRIRQPWGGRRDEPKAERVIWVALAHVRHLEWADMRNSTVIEFAG